MKKETFWNLRQKEVVMTALVVVTVLGISLVQLRLGEMKTRDAARRADTELVGRALDAYFKDHEQYPASKNGQIVSCGNKGLDACQWGNSTFIDVDGVTYLKNMPNDPFATKGWKYVYEVDESGKMFRVYARLEYTSDPVVKSEQTIECSSGVKCNWFVQNNL